MIAKLPKKDIVGLLYITVLTAVALYYGFTSIPSPIDQRAQTLDRQRVVHLGDIKYAIEDQYRTANTLPQTLDGLEKDQYSSQTLVKQDPETAKPYEYTKLSEYSYKLCATFATDTMAETNEKYDAMNYRYSSVKEQFEHPKGYYCFTLDVPANTYYNVSPMPSYVPSYPTPTITFLTQPTPNSGFMVKPTAAPMDLPAEN